MGIGTIVEDFFPVGGGFANDYISLSLALALFTGAFAVSEAATSVTGGTVALSGIVVNSISRAEEKADAKYVAVSTTDTKNLNAIRFQLQTGKSTVSSVVKVSEDEIAVKKAEAFVSLQTLYTTTAVIEPGLIKSNEFISAIIRMSEVVKNVPGTSGEGNVMRETFVYQDREYRIDLENLRGINLVE